jgi:V/A-type H+-transporting ATPase subunit C
VPDFPYINARVRAMHSRLLTPAQVDDLMGAASLAVLQQALASTPYAPDLHEALTRFDGVPAVDAMLARNLRRTTRSILTWADGAARRLIEVILVRWDVANLRVLVRGRHADRPPEEMLEALLPAGTLSEVVLREMAHQPDLVGVAAMLESVNHPLAAPIVQAVDEYATGKDLVTLEVAVDRAYIAWGMAQARRRGANGAALRRVLQAEVDVANVKTALRLANAGDVDEETRLRHFIPGGPLVTREVFRGLTAPAMRAQAWKILRRSGFPIKELPADLVAFEREIDLLMVKGLADHYRGDPLGLDIVIGYLARKSAEVANLRLIARGVLLGMARETVRRELIHV